MTSEYMYIEWKYIKKEYKERGENIIVSHILDVIRATKIK